MNLINQQRSIFRRIWVFWPLLIPLLLFIPGLNDFAYSSPDAPYSDLVISHYPNALYLKRAIVEWRVIPLWSPTILSGYPFAANPLSGLWYPPGWLALLFPLPLGFNLVVMVHLLLGGIGLYRLLRIEGLPHQAALFGALAFESLPKFFAQYGAGHLTLIYAISWTPWLIAFGVERLRQPSWLQPGPILALIFLADPRWAPYAGLLWILYYVAHSQYRKREVVDTDDQPEETLPFIADQSKSPISNLKFLLSNLLIAALLTAPLALPLLEYARNSTRNALTIEDIFAFSLPPARLLGLLFPDFGGNHEWMIYPGGAVLALLFVAVIASIRRKKVHFWLLVFILSALFAMGSNLPLQPALAKIPGFDLLRVPARALFLTGMAGAVLASYGLDALIVRRKEKTRGVSLVLMGLTTFCVVFTLSVGVLVDVWARNFLWGAGAVLVGSIWILGLLKGKISHQIWIVGLFGMAILDWSAVSASVLSFRPNDLISSQGGSIGGYLSENKDHFRVYSPSYSLPQEVAVMYGLELADGVDPLQLAAYSDFMDSATGVPRTGYSITLPPFADGNPGFDNAGYSLDPRMLGLLNVGYIVAAYELPIDGLSLQEWSEKVCIYENTLVLPRAWIQSSDGQIGANVTPVEVVDWQPNRITIRAYGPGLLVLSEIAYPGWRVSVDQKPAEMEAPLGLLRGVLIAPGDHSVIFSYHPWSIYIGIGCFLFGVGLLVLWIRYREQRFR